jgi:hypothetical protein
MPQITARINGEQRDAIYELVVEHLSFLADLRFAINGGDFDTARRLAQEFREDFRLLDDLGWGEDGRLEVALTIPPEELVAALRRLRADAKGGLSESPCERESREADEASKRSYQLVFDTASELLIELDRLEKEPA